MKTFGALRKGGEGWVVSAQADVATRLKRTYSDYGADPAMMDTLDLKKMEAELLVNGGEADDGKFEEIDSRTKQNHLREMAAKALRDTHGTRKEALVAS